MNHWPFIAAAYGLTLASLAILVAAGWRSMRAAEALAAELTRRR